jgi:hypothetical protein
MGARSSTPRKKKGNGCGCLLAVIAVAVLLFAVYVGTSAPSFSNAAGNSSAETAYLYEFTVGLTLIQEGMDGLVPLLSEPKLLDIEWRQQLTGYLATIKLGYEHVEALTPPTSLATMDEMFLSGAHDCYAATDYLATGIDDSDPSSLAMAGTLIGSCNQQMATSTAMLEEMKAPGMRAKAAPQEPIPFATIAASTTATPGSLAAQTVATANNVANLRQGPGTDHAILGTTQIGQELVVVGRNATGDWYQLDSGMWIAAFLVDNAPATLPVVSE